MGWYAAQSRKGATKVFFLPFLLSSKKIQVVKQSKWRIFNIPNYMLQGDTVNWSGNQLVPVD